MYDGSSVRNFADVTNGGEGVVELIGVEPMTS